MIVVRLSRRELRQAQACGEGLALFDAIKAGQDEVRAAAGRKPRRCLRLQWTLVHQLWMATAYPGFFGWLGDVGLLPRVHAKSGANLRGAYLDGANLRGAYLDGANLRGAYLDGANLVGAYLRGANLVGANLRGANLRGANLRGANLRGAYLDGANLVGAYLRGANLVGANLVGARNWPASTPLPDGFRIAACRCCVERGPAPEGGAS